MKHTDEHGFPTRPQYMSPDEFRNLIGIERNYYYEKLKKAGEKPPGRLISPDEQKLLCKIFKVPYFFNDTADTDDKGRGQTLTDDTGKTV
jgi:hypothetical protein